MLLTLTTSHRSSRRTACRYCRTSCRSTFVNTGATARSHANAASLSTGLLKSNFRSQIAGSRGSLIIRLELVRGYLQVGVGPSTVLDPPGCFRAARNRRNFDGPETLGRLVPRWGKRAG